MTDKILIRLDPKLGLIPEDEVYTLPNGQVVGRAGAELIRARARWYRSFTRTWGLQRCHKAAVSWFVEATYNEPGSMSVIWPGRKPTSSITPIEIPERYK